jgi:hypothetical protein
MKLLALYKASDWGKLCTELLLIHGQTRLRVDKRELVHEV